MSKKLNAQEESVTLKHGIQWPIESGGKTTNVAKDIWCAAADAGNENSLSKAIRNERNWRFGYSKHLAKLGDITAASSRDNAKHIASSGLNEMLKKFVFVQLDNADPRNITTTTLYDLGNIPYPGEGKSKFSTKKLEGTKAIPSELSFAYQKGTLEASQIGNKMKEWVEYGTCEPDCTDKVLKVVPALAEGSLKGKWFVLLGAGSEMGPLKFLLTYGANVIAIRTRKSKGWLNMAKIAEDSAGTLFVPIAKDEKILSDGDAVTINWSEMAGCDILTETLDIRNWIIDVLGGPNPKTEVTVGLYTYLDSEAHVRVTLGCDVIMTGIEKAFSRTRFAYIGSTSVSTAITQEMEDAVSKNRAASPLWMKATRCLPPVTSKLENVMDSQSEDKTIHLRHGFILAQGPNYALAKTAQVWRAMIATNYPSFCVGPITRTESVCHNTTMAAMLKSYDRIKPYEIMDPPCASTILGLLLAYDILFEELDRDQKTGHPFERTLGGSFHSGDLRGPYNVESSKCLSGVLFVLGKYC